MPDHHLNAVGLNCPEPVILTRQALAVMQAGETLMVVATDPGAVLDFQAFCRMSGHSLLDMQEEAEQYRFLIRKGATGPVAG
jgi:tRNA 2-thiouridine synthesizing protein A